MPTDPDQLLGELTLEEKVGLLAGIDLWHLPEIPRIGLASLKMSDGPNGARGERSTGGPPSALFPCGTALAATFDTALMERVGQALGAEARSKGAHVLLAPTVNLHRHPLGGRDFECYSEDPYLSARMAVAFVTGVQSEGVAACVKHLVANDAEYERFTCSSDVSERALRELYLVPFEAALLEAGAWAVMSGYNRLNGTHCSQHTELLTGLLRDEWAWDGTVVSDWWGSHTTVEALDAGLDIEMPGPPQHRGQKLLDAVKAGDVGEDRVDRAVGRILLLAHRTGALGANGEAPPQPEERFDDDPQRVALIREAAAASIVVMQNDDVLPLNLDGTELHRVAVIGPNATRLHPLGGGSAHVTAPHIVTPLAGLEAAATGTELVHERGAPPASPVSRIEPARIQIEYFANRDVAGDPVATHTGGRSLFVWLGSEPPAAGLEGDNWSARMTMTYRPAVSGEHTLELRARGRSRLTIDGTVAIDVWDEAPDRRSRLDATADLGAGADHTVVLEHAPAAGSGPMVIADLRVGQPPDPDEQARAVELAATTDAAIVIVGLDNDTETEGHDRPGFDLPAEQVELIEQVAGANPRTIVVVNAASPVNMGWADRVAAVVQLWCPGQEGGHALADVLTGAVNPSGRLPTTFPERIEDTPAFLTWPGERGHAVYGEGVFIGYRAYDRRRMVPRFPFGHGLSYTTFAYENLTVADRVGQGQPIRGAVTIRNTGDVAGAEVVQIYVRGVEATVMRPEKELKAFARVPLDPGQSAVVPFQLEPRALSFWDEDTHQWRAEPGQFELLVGASSADIRVAAAFTLEDC